MGADRWSAAAKWPAPVTSRLGSESGLPITCAALQHTSHNTQYVNKPLIYIIKISTLLYLPRRNRSRGYSAGDLISGAKLIDGVEQTAFRMGCGDLYRLGSRLCDERSVLRLDKPQPLGRIWNPQGQEQLDANTD
jgi:hypothetical protein